ncbi:MAG: Rho termination factor N-terminal domain-containing protein, partial [Actinomycetota bacterium]|nr:Rho termination factor N-terminal domain-containing protein [Actinomycetota bacterium]
MTAGQQLERSVLEGKEREELHAIAQAMSLKTTSRTKKADIIDRILEAAGVTASPDPSSNGGNGHGAASGAVPASANGVAHRDATAAAERAGAPTAAAEAAEPETTSSTDGAAAHDRGPRGDVALPGAGGEVARGAGEPGQERGATGAEPRGAGDRSNVQASQSQSYEPGPGNAPGSRQSQRQQGRHPQTNSLEPGNRRNRRRRGRERGTGGERDLQGSAGQEAPYQGELIEVRGLLDLRDEGYGFLRCDGYLPSSKDVYVSISQARRFALRKGDYVEGACRPASSNEKYPALLRIDKVSGMDPEAARQRPRFEDLTPLFPDERLTLEVPGVKDDVTARIVDLLSPIGKGQRGLIVS